MLEIGRAYGHFFVLAALGVSVPTLLWAAATGTPWNTSNMLTHLEPMVPFWDQYIEGLTLGVSSSSSSSAAAAAYILIPRSASGHKEFEVCYGYGWKIAPWCYYNFALGSLYTQTIQCWWSSAVAVSAKKFVRSRSHSGMVSRRLFLPRRVGSRAALSGKELGRLGLAIHWGICGHGNRITPEHHTSHHCRTCPFCITSKHTSSGNIAYMMYICNYIYNIYIIL